MNNDPIIPRVSRIRQFIALFALVFATGAWAAEDEKKCSSEIYTAIERDLRLADFAERAQDESEGFIVSEACKTWPYKPELTLVALAYDAGVEDEKELVIAVFDKKRKRVVHSYQRRIVEDSSIAVGERSLEFDTARYQLADNVRAFGLRFHSSANRSSAAEAHRGNQLTLFVSEGKSLRPVLSLYMLQTRFVLSNGHDSIWRTAHLTISVEDVRSLEFYDYGFYNLRVTANIIHHLEGGDPFEEHTEHVIFGYNGKHYEPIAPWWIGGRNSPIEEFIDQPPPD
jgi:hypothetical protein